MAQAGEGGTAGPPLQPLPGGGRAGLRHRRRAHAAQPLRPPGQLRAAQALRGLPLPAARPRAGGPARRLPGPPLPPAAAAAAPDPGHAAALHLRGLLPEPAGQPLGGPPPAQARAQPAAAAAPGPAPAAAPARRPRGPAQRRRGRRRRRRRRGARARLAARRLADGQRRRPARHRPPHQQHRLAQAEGARVRAAPGDAAQERRPHQLKPRPRVRPRGPPAFSRSSSSPRRNWPTAQLDRSYTSTNEDFGRTCTEINIIIHAL